MKLTVKKNIPLALLLLSLISLASCGRSQHGLEVAPVSGRVTVDGQPLSQGRITFLPRAGKAAWSQIQSDGSYQLTTYARNDGAIVGEHRVTVTAITNQEEVNASAESDVRVKPISLVPKRYAASTSSGLSFTVKADESNEANFSLDAH